MFDMNSLFSTKTERETPLPSGSVSYDEGTRNDDRPAGLGRDINLIRLIQEHGPLRIQEIDREMKKMNERLTALNDERDTLQKLVAVLS